MLLTRKMSNLSVGGDHEMNGGYRVYLTPSKRFPSLLHCAFCYRGTMSVLASEVRLGWGCGVYRMLKIPSRYLDSYKAEQT